MADRHTSVLAKAATNLFGVAPNKLSVMPESCAVRSELPALRVADFIVPPAYYLPWPQIVTNGHVLTECRSTFTPSLAGAAVYEPVGGC